MVVGTVVVVVGTVVVVVGTVVVVVVVVVVGMHSSGSVAPGPTVVVPLGHVVGPVAPSTST